MLSQCGGFVPPDYRVDVVLMSIAQLFLRWRSATLDWSMLPAQWGTTIWTQWDGSRGKTAGLLLHLALRLEQQVGKWKGQLVLKKQRITCSGSYLWGGKTKHQFSWEKKKLQEACKEGTSAVSSFRQEEALIKWDISAWPRLGITWLDLPQPKPKREDVFVTWEVCNLQVPLWRCVAFSLEMSPCYRHFWKPLFSLQLPTILTMMQSPIKLAPSSEMLILLLA